MRLGTNLLYLLLFASGILVLAAGSLVRYTSAPGITPDEYTYMVSAFFGNGELGFGNFLFSALFSSAESCGQYWYECAKTLNFVFDVLGAISIGVFVFYLSRDRVLATFAGSLYLTSIVSMYGFAFMPESMYRFFLISSILGLIALQNHSWRWHLLPGVLLGLAMSTKPHAFFVFVGLAVLWGLVLIFKKRFPSFPAVNVGVFLFTAIIVRLALGLLLVGPSSINVLARYAGSIPSVDRFFGSAGSGDSGNPALDFSGALLAFLVSLLPAIVLLAAFAIVFYTSTRRTLGISDSSVVILLTVFGSLVLMTAGFMGLLELRGLEDGLSRTVTRYWEFMVLPLLLIFVLPLAKKYKDDLVDKSDWNVLKTAAIGVLCLIILLSGFGMLISLNPQNQADSSLLHGGVATFLLIAGSWPIVNLVMKRFGDRMTAIVAFSMLFALSVSTWAPFTSYMLQDKAGQMAGIHLTEHLKNYPEDRDRVAIFGEGSAVTTVAFMAKLQKYEGGATNFYSVLDEGDFEGDPRWVIASKENFFAGDYLSSRKVGDMVIYERQFPVLVEPIDFQKYDVKSDGTFLNTYWGGWVADSSFSFVVPSGMKGTELDLRLLVNEELQDRRVLIEFDDRSVEGELEINQALTPVVLSRQDGETWEGVRVTVTYLGDEEDVLNSGKQLGLGFAGFMLYDLVAQ